MYEKSPRGWTKHFDFFILDFLWLNFSLVLSFILKFGFDIQTIIRYNYVDNAVMLSLIFVCVVFLYNGGYKNILKRGYYRELTQVIKQALFVFVSMLLIMYLTKRTQLFPRVIFFACFCIYTIASYCVHIIHKNFLIKKLSGKGKRSVIVVCALKNAEKIIEGLSDKNFFSQQINGIIIVDKDMRGQKIMDIPVVAYYDDADRYLCQNWVDEVFIGKKADSDMRDFIEQLSDDCRKMGITIHRIITDEENAENNITVERMGRFIVTSQSVTIVTKRDMFFKRALDICGGLVGCFLTVILFVIIAPCIYIASPGPIFFSQNRVGKNGKLFKIYKFRSMYMDAEQRKAELMAKNRVKDGMMFKMDNDPRIIKGIGHFIRDLSIDEFPQFFNVLSGDMSLVGTRPPTLDEWEKYELHHRKRLAIKPGLTGMWQVSGRSNITDFEEIVKLDTRYIENWSLLLDIKIILKTVLVVLKKEGSQ